MKLTYLNISLSGFLEEKMVKLVNHLINESLQSDTCSAGSDDSVSAVVLNKGRSIIQIV